MTDAEKKIKIRTSFLWLQLPFLDKELEPGHSEELMSANLKPWIDFLADGTRIGHDVLVQTNYSLSETVSTKSTQKDMRFDSWGEAIASESSTLYHYDEINAADIMFARGILSVLTGTSRKIKWI